MKITPQNIEERLKVYCKRTAKNMILPQLGWGQDGHVYSTNHRTAIKGYKYFEHYQNELAVYIRLQEHEIARIEGFSVPTLVDADDELAVLEMGTVEPPFVLDFVAAYLDRSPPYSESQTQEAMDYAESRFGEDWDQVLSILSAFRRYGIHLVDLKPENIKFR